VRFVERAEIRPSRCAVFPHIGGNHRSGYFDSGSEMPGFDNHVYVSVVAAEAMALKLGWSSPEDVKTMRNEYETLERECERLREENADLNREFEAIDVLASRGFVARKKPGRKPKED
jgi:sRNA-binding carbon storage regulator CsrA